MSRDTNLNRKLSLVQSFFTGILASNDDGLSCELKRDSLRGIYMILIYENASRRSNHHLADADL